MVKAFKYILRVIPLLLILSCVGEPESEDLNVNGDLSEFANDSGNEGESDFTEPNRSFAILPIEVEPATGDSLKITWEKPETAKEVPGTYDISISKNYDCREPLFVYTDHPVNYISSDPLSDGVWYVCVVHNYGGGSVSANNNPVEYTLDLPADPKLSPGVYWVTNASANSTPYQIEGVGANYVEIVDESTIRVTTAGDMILKRFGEIVNRAVCVTNGSSKNVYKLNKFNEIVENIETENNCIYTYPPPSDIQAVKSRYIEVTEDSYKLKSVLGEGDDKIEIVLKYELQEYLPTHQFAISNLNWLPESGASGAVDSAALKVASVVVERKIFIDGSSLYYFFYYENNDELYQGLENILTKKELDSAASSNSEISDFLQDYNDGVGLWRWRYSFQSDDIYNFSSESITLDVEFWRNYPGGLAINNGHAISSVTMYYESIPYED